MPDTLAVGLFRLELALEWALLTWAPGTNQGAFVDQTTNYSSCSRSLKQLCAGKAASCSGGAVRWLEAGTLELGQLVFSPGFTASQLCDHG